MTTRPPTGESDTGRHVAAPCRARLSKVCRSKIEGPIRRLHHGGHISVVVTGCSIGIVRHRLTARAKAACTTSLAHWPPSTRLMSSQQHTRASSSAVTGSAPAPPLSSYSPSHVCAAVATCMRNSLPSHIADSAAAIALPDAVFAALVARVAGAAVTALTAEWAAAVAEAMVLKEAASARAKEQAGVGLQWNNRSRAVGALGCSGMGYGANVLPYLHRSVEGRAVHATCVELRVAATRTKWLRDVRRCV